MPTSALADAEPLPRTPEEAAASRLAQLITCRTVSSRDPEDVDPREFSRFRRLLAELYPLVHEALEFEQVSGGGLLYRWPGRAGSSGTATPPAPIVLMAHYDVVPVEDEDTWEHPPFAGVIEGGYIHGRGALDDKGALAAILEAAEALLQEGFVPERDVYLSFGDNEETAGDTAAAIAETLAVRGVRPWLVLDEGGAVAAQAFPFVNRPVAVVGVSEKGILDVELSVEDSGGHASTPSRRGATSRLARAVVRLDNRPFPASLHPVTLDMLGRLSTGASLLPGLLFARAGTLRRPLTRVFGALGGEPNALTRTTVAVTRLQGSKASNVLATRASATANIRIAPGGVHWLRPGPAPAHHPGPESLPPRDRRNRAVAGVIHHQSTVRPAGTGDRGGLPGCHHRPVHHARRHRLPPFHHHLRRRLPLRAVPDGQGSPRVHPRGQREARR